MDIELMEHQINAVELLGNGKILYGEVGIGKSATVLQYYILEESPKDIYVITTAKKRDALDWPGEAVRFGIGTEYHATMAGKLTVDSWNNIDKYIDVEDAFFVFDEQRLVGSGSWVKSFLKIARNGNTWVMLTATPGDTWIDYAPVFIANGWYKNLTDFKRQHVIYAPYVKFPKIIRYVGTDKLEQYRNDILVEMPYEKHTVRILNYLDVGYDRELWDTAVKRRWNPYTDAPMKDVSELFRVMRRISNTDPSRLDMVKMLMETHPKLVIFYNFNYELRILRALEDEITIAEWNGHKKEPIPKTYRWLYLVQYNAGSEGWNCTETDAMILYSLTYSYKQFIQAQGRIDRLNTPFTNLYYYILGNSSAIDRAVTEALREKRNFNERKMMERWPKPANNL
jgi:hypothetical protein